MTISIIFIKTCLHWLNLTEKTPKYLEVFKISLNKFAQKLPNSHRQLQIDGNHPISHNTKHLQQAVYKKNTR